MTTVSEQSKKSTSINAYYSVGNLEFLDSAAENLGLNRSKFVVTSGAPLMCLFNDKTFSDTVKGLKLPKALTRLSKNMFLLEASDWEKTGITEEEWNGFVEVYLKLDYYLAAKNRAQRK